MPPYYYAIRDTDSYADAVLHADRGCPDGPVRAAGSTVGGELCPECTDAGGGGNSESDGEQNAVAPVEPDPEAYIGRGECPWCDDYEGEYVRQHASSAHPDAWDEYKS